MRFWGMKLLPMAPFVVLVAVPTSVAITGGAALVLGAGAIALNSLRRDSWKDFRPRATERFDPDAGELFDPGLVTELGLDGLRVDRVLKGGSGTNAWTAFQTVDRLGGRVTRMIVELPGRGESLTMVSLAGSRPAIDRLNLTGLFELESFRIRRHRDAPSRDILSRLSTPAMKAALRVPEVAEWGGRGRWMYAQLTGIVNLRGSLDAAQRWLLQLRDAFPRSLLRPVAPADRTTEPEWELMDEGRPLDDE